MPAITDISAAPATGGFFFDDKEAITQGAEKDGFSFNGRPTKPGFKQIRQPAEALSISIELETEEQGVGDCTAVQYSGFGGRDKLFDARAHVDVIESTLAEALVGHDASNFLSNINVVQETHETVESLHTAVRYGISQALLDAAAKAQSKTMSEVVLDEYDLRHSPSSVPIFSQTGTERRKNAEKMILKEIPVLPHGLFNSIDETGQEGEKLIEYIEWLRNRVDELGSAEYDPVFHVDVYGTIGEIFGPPYDRAEVIEFFSKLNHAASDYPLQVESPIEASSRDEQIRVLGELTDGLAESAVPVDIVADEWCNTYDDITSFVDAGAVDIVQVKTPDLGEVTKSIEAVQYCDGTDTAAYLGGSCAETDISARVSTHLAVATQPVQMLAKPGMGVDEGYLIVNNEMTRTLNRLSDATQRIQTSASNDSGQ